MRERIQTLGGRLEVDSGVGRGTRVQARVPWRVERRERTRP
jgi:signal transduction histidine kinase